MTPPALLTEPLPPPTSRRARHAETAFDDDLHVCEEAVTQQSGLAYVAHFTAGVFDFSVDRLQRSAPHETYLRTGRRLDYTLACFDAVCAPLASGDLIRLVAHGDHGAIYHVLKVRGRCFFGLAQGDHERVRSADVTMARIAEEAVGQQGLETLDWGGFRERGRIGQDTEELFNDAGWRRPEPFLSASSARWYDDPRLPRCREALGLTDLHYVGVYGQGRCMFSADILDDGLLTRRFFAGTTPGRRRQGYHEVSRQYAVWRPTLQAMLDTIGGGPLMRLVLNVAEGAVTIVRLTGDEYLLGVTLMRNRVDAADRKLRQLAVELTA